MRLRGDREGKRPTDTVVDVSSLGTQNAQSAIESENLHVVPGEDEAVFEGPRRFNKHDER